MEPTCVCDCDSNVSDDGCAPASPVPVKIDIMAISNTSISQMLGPNGWLVSLMWVQCIEIVSLV